MFVFPMMGRSSRFARAGYALPKYRLPLHGQPVFRHVVRSFERYFADDFFLFLVRRDHDARGFLETELKLLGVKACRIVELDGDTHGQADTVHRGIAAVSPAEPLYVFNIDSIRPGFEKAAGTDGCAGYLEVFEGEGDHWSFVEPGSDGSVRRTAEKERISRLCSNGLYHFASAALFREAFARQRECGPGWQGEYYVAPLYNILIRRGHLVRHVLVDRSATLFCGTPREYRALARLPRTNVLAHDLALFAEGEPGP